MVFLKLYCFFMRSIFIILKISTVNEQNFINEIGGIMISTKHGMGRYLS